VPGVVTALGAECRTPRAGSALSTPAARHHAPSAAAEGAAFANGTVCERNKGVKSAGMRPTQGALTGAVVLTLCGRLLTACGARPICKTSSTCATGLEREAPPRLAASGRWVQWPGRAERRRRTPSGPPPGLVRPAAPGLLVRPRTGRLANGGTTLNGRSQRPTIAVAAVARQPAATTNRPGHRPPGGRPAPQPPQGESVVRNRQKRRYVGIVAAERLGVPKRATRRLKALQDQQGFPVSHLQRRVDPDGGDAFVACTSTPLAGPGRRP
jgi:hypothetical protein